MAEANAGARHAAPVLYRYEWTDDEPAPESVSVGFSGVLRLDGRKVAVPATFKAEFEAIWGGSFRPVKTQHAEADKQLAATIEANLPELTRAAVEENRPDFEPPTLRAPTAADRAEATPGQPA